mmetsp:Transcript_9887/g.60290  ORF Transcript_9887/g.60290 Transcript_9887/m.60290 type:complete len:204 (+) Transcript_9887:737-1348(+)
MPPEPQTKTQPSHTCLDGTRPTLPRKHIPGHRTSVSIRLRTPGDVRQTTTTATPRQIQADTNEEHGQGKRKEDRGNRGHPALGPRMVGSSRRTRVPRIPKVQELRRQPRRSVVECRSERATAATGILPALPQSGRTVGSVWDGGRQQLRPSQDVQWQRPAPHRAGRVSIGRYRDHPLRPHRTPQRTRGNEALSPSRFRHARVL